MPRKGQASGAHACCLALALPAMDIGGEAATTPPAALGLPEDLSFTAASDGSPQHYVQMLPKNATNEVDSALVALHGHGSDRWQYVKQDRGECRAARDFAAAHGMLFVSPDYRASASWMGPAAEADMVQLIARLRTKHHIRRVFLTGASMGGTAALIFAALHPDLVAGVSSQNGTANMMEFQGFQESIAASYGGDKVKKPGEYRKRSPELVPETFIMPAAFAVGGQDATVPPDSVRRLAAKLKQRDTGGVLLLDRQAGGHATSYADTMASLEFVLKAADAKQ